MTENEKASTFIGWKRWTCDNDEPDPHRQCFKCHKVHERAPDMDDPRNHMKAFWGLVERGLYVESSLYLASDGPFVRYTIWPKEGCVSDDHPPLAEIRDRKDRQPEIRVLAALWDAEHKA